MLERWDRLSPNEQRLSFCRKAILHSSHRPDQGLLPAWEPPSAPSPPDLRTSAFLGTKQAQGDLWPRNLHRGKTCKDPALQLKGGYLCLLQPWHWHIDACTYLLGSVWPMVAATQAAGKMAQSVTRACGSMNYLSRHVTKIYDKTT